MKSTQQFFTHPKGISFHQFSIKVDRESMLDFLDEKIIKFCCGLDKHVVRISHTRLTQLLDTFTFTPPPAYAQYVKIPFMIYTG